MEPISTQTGPIPETTVGYLSKTSEAAGVIFAECTRCGYKAVPVPLALWGSIKCCNACFEEVDKIEAELEASRREESIRQAKDAAERERLVDAYVRPHFADLPADLKKLFRALAGSTFDLGNVASEHHCSVIEAWRVTQELLSFNVLVELKGPLGEIRPYGSLEAYEAAASPNSKYRCRQQAIAQQQALDGISPTVTAEPISQALPQAKPAGRDKTAASLVASFVAERCVVGPGAVSRVLLVNAFQHWLTSQPQAMDISPDEFRSHLADLSVSYDKRAARVQGIRMRTKAELTAPQSDAVLAAQA
jgi:hypothetical protein